MVSELFWTGIFFCQKLNSIWMVVLGSVLNAKHFESVIFCKLPTEDESCMFIMSRN
jgi:hypothetical protein